MKENWVGLVDEVCAVFSGLKWLLQLSYSGILAIDKALWHQGHMFGFSGLVGNM